MNPGDRVSYMGYLGTLAEIIRQHFGDNLARVDWDTLPDNHDLFVAADLTICTTEDLAA